MSYTFRKREDIEKTLELIGRPTPPKLLPKPGVLEARKLTYGLVFEVPLAGIDGRNGMSLNSAECVPHYLNDSGQLTELLKSDGSQQTVTVYNPFSSAIGGEAIITAKLVFNKWVADAEDC